MKIIPSLTHNLQRRVEELESQLAEKDAKIHRLEESLKQKSRNPITSRKDSLTSIRSESSFQTSISNKSFLQPTAASRRRSVAVNISSPGSRLGSQASLVHESAASSPSPLYHDGQLIKEASFIKSTWSTIYKTRGKYRPSNQNDDEEDEDDEPSGPPEDASLWNEPITPTLEPTPVCTTCEKLEWCDYHPQARSQSLETRSRLYPHSRDPFYNPKNPASDMYPPNHLMSRLLRRALRLAQETVWFAFRTHWPEQQRQLYPEGPEEVKLGYGEVEDAFGTWSKRRGVEGEAEQFCHPDWRTPWGVDSLIHDAQALAVTMRDERRAFKIRALQDDLQAAQIKAYDELLSFVDHASLPGAKPWPLHHQRSFEDTLYHMHSGADSNRYSSVLILAAKDWETKYIRPGQLDPSYVDRAERAADNIKVPSKADRENMTRLKQIQRVTRSLYQDRYEQAQKYMRETPSHGRRASLPGAMPGVPGDVLELEREILADSEQDRVAEREVKELSLEGEEGAKAA
ncbi:hypothetical protein LTR86_004239 [Recurvomyces mirabilis]|nr:hypothetical protein LTR86_004239 [Recurvomyces mirabilis]